MLHKKNCLINIKNIYNKVMIFHTNVFSDSNTGEYEDLEVMRKKLRDLHKLDAVMPSINSKQDPVLCQPDADVEYNADELQERSDLILNKDLPKDKKQAEFIKSIAEKKFKDKDNLIITSYGVIRTDNMNRHLNQTKNQFNKERDLTNRLESNEKSKDQTYFSDIIFHANDLSITEQQISRVTNNENTISKPDTLQLKNNEVNDNNEANDRSKDQTYFSDIIFHANDLSITEQQVSRVTNNEDTISKPDNLEKAEDTLQFNKNEVNAFDKEYFGELIKQENLELEKNNETNMKDEFTENIINNNNLSKPQDTVQLQNKNSLFDQEYFGGLIKQENTEYMDERKNSEHFSHVDYTNTIPNRILVPSKKLNDNLNNIKNNIFDEQYFSGSVDRINQEKPLKPQESVQKDLRSVLFPNQKENLKNLSQNNRKYDSDEYATGTKEGLQLNNKFRNKNIEVQEGPLHYADHNDDTIYHQTITKREAKQSGDYELDLDEPKTAYDLVLKMRRKKHDANSIDKNIKGPQSIKGEWAGRMDSKGFRILKEQTLDLSLLPKADVVSILKDSVLFEDDKIVVIDKPYGLPSHGGPGVVNSVGQLLQDLTNRLNKNATAALQMVHRLDRETTGVMILAKTDQSADILRGMFKEKQIIKKYWAITKGIPNPTEGIIDIPMGEGSVENRYRMELRPDYPSAMRMLGKTNKNKGTTKYAAITKYKVLSHNNGAALLECEPETGVKHQIRCHLSFGLNTPILGDHKYSHYNRLAPQKLPSTMLERLNIRQETVRYVPMHLHSHSIILQQFVDGRNLFISAKPPRHFFQNLKWLKLFAPRGRS